LLGSKMMLLKWTEMYQEKFKSPLCWTIIRKVYSIWSHQKRNTHVMNVGNNLYIIRILIATGW
jgi:hypothetical protein